MDGSAAAPAHDEGESLELLTRQTSSLWFDSPRRRGPGGGLARTRTDTNAIVLERPWFLRAVAWFLQWRVVYYGLFLLV
eukprot:COSAG06_NODE_17147_length_959_cov_0.819767_2_plen_78_part_01